jgi:hypothetical protein
MSEGEYSANLANRGLAMGKIYLGQVAGYGSEVL